MGIEWGPLSIIVVCITIVAISLIFKNEIKRLVRIKTTQKKSLEPIIETKQVNYGVDEHFWEFAPIDELALSLEEGEGQTWLEAFNKQEYTVASVELEKYISTLEGPTDVLKNKCILAYVNSMIDFDYAVELFIELMDQFPTEKNVYLWFSKIYSSKKLYLQAITILDAGLEAIQKDPDLVLLKAECLGEMGNHQEGIDCILGSLDKKTYTSIIYTTLAKLYKALDDQDQQLNILIKGYQLNRLNDRDLLEFSNELERIGKTKESLYLLKALERKNPKDFNVICHIGNIYYKLGLYDLALSAYLEADKISGGNQEWIKANIGNLYQSIGFYTVATDHLKKAVKLSSEYEYALERLTQAVESKNKEANIQKDYLKDAQDFFLQRI